MNNIGLRVKVGNGRFAYFWKDKWPYKKKNQQFVSDVNQF